MNINKSEDDIYFDDEIDVKEIIIGLWKRIWLILSITLFVSIASVVYAVSLPDIYKTQAILSPIDDNNSNGNSLRGYNNLANLAGININSSSSSKSVEAIKTLSSLKFFSNSLMPNIFTPNIIAVQNWDAKENKITYNSNIYDFDNNKWTREAIFPRSVEPSDQELFTIFNEQLSIFVDKDTGFITLTMEHESPYIAQKWLSMIIYEINKIYRMEDKKKASLAISYLNKQISLTSLTEIKQALSRLIQNETQKMMLIEANEDYIFKVIDPPIVEEIKSKPKRAIICLMGSLLGLMLAIFIAIILNSYSQKSLNKS